MNKLKLLVVFILGGIAGAFTTNMILKEEYEKQAKIDQEDARAWVKVQIEKHLAEQQEPLNEEVEEEDPGPLGNELPTGQKTNYNKAVKKYDTQANKKDLETVMLERGLRPNPNVVNDYDHPKDDEPEEDEEAQPDTQPIMEDDGPTSIRVLTSHEFFNSMENYAKITLTYYEGDNTVTDDRDGVVRTPEKIVGPRALECFDTDAVEDPNVVYVRNNNNSSDYEIVRNKGYYVEEVLGVKQQHNTKRAKIVPPVGKMRQQEEPKRSTKPRVKKAVKDGTE
jgi:hypothetical protein